MYITLLDRSRPGKRFRFLSLFSSEEGEVPELCNISLYFTRFVAYNNLN
jgi:hypothetical protein